MMKGLLNIRDYFFELEDFLFISRYSGLKCFHMKNSLESFRDRFFINKNHMKASLKFEKVMTRSIKNWKNAAYDHVQKLQNNIGH
jgi:hypothetical protein